MPQVRLLEKLERMSGGRNSLAGWRRVLGADFDEVRPLLTAVTGERASTYPCPVFGTALTVREQLGGNRYVAFASGDDAGTDDEDLDLTWEDVQAWAVDGKKLGEALQGCKGGEDDKDDRNDGVTHEDILREVLMNRETLSRQGLDQLRQQQQQRETISEMAQGPADFLAGLRIKLTKQQMQSFIDLVETVQEDGRKRARSYAEIALTRGITRQAVGKRATALYKKHKGIKDYVTGIRHPEKDEFFSEMGPQRRRKAGIDKSYGYDDE